MNNLLNNAQNVPIYKPGDVILLEDEYIATYKIDYEKSYGNTITHVIILCPCCNKEIETHKYSRYISSDLMNSSDLLSMFHQHLRTIHSGEFVTVKNSYYDKKMNVFKFTLVKKIFI